MAREIRWTHSAEKQLEKIYNYILLDSFQNASSSSEDNRKFYGINFGAGVKCLLGIEVSFKLGFKF